MRIALISIGLVITQAYRIAMINDIHADLNYNPLSGTCISKSSNPLTYVKYKYFHKFLGRFQGLLRSYSRTTPL